MTDFESEQYIEVCRERDVLKARIAELEGKGEKPFNGHTELPWDMQVCENQEAVGTSTTYDLHHESDDGFSFVAEFENKEDAEFAIHAVNSHYPLTAQVRSLRGAAQAAADAMAWIKPLALAHAISHAHGMEMHPVHAEAMKTTDAALFTLAENGITPKDHEE